MCKGKQQMKFWKLASVTTALVLSTSANAALIERLGGMAYYDDVADLTWLADANYSRTQYLNSGGTEGYSNGEMTWGEARNWAADLDVAGVTGWRLPRTQVPDPSCEYNNYSCTGSEMGNMFYNVLGGIAGYSIYDAPAVTGNLNVYLFDNLINNDQYFSSTVVDPDATPGLLQAYTFYFGIGNQSVTYASSPNLAWAVHDGDISAVPVPAAVWLFGSGLISLVGFSRRKKS